MSINRRDVLFYINVLICKKTVYKERYAALQAKTSVSCVKMLQIKMQKNHVSFEI